MAVYRTIKEKAEEWDVSLRHLQYLCKKGEVEGAIKKAGVWFIPDNASLPPGKAKNKNGQFHFVGTKKKIFDCAIELFQSRGYEAVSIKDIADAVGITQSSVYNHFPSKQKILNTIYDFYSYSFLIDRPHLESLDPILETGSLTDIIRSVRYRFSDDRFKRMADITTLIFHRYVIDDRARELTQTLMIDEGIHYVQSVFDRAVAIGRIAPVKTREISLLINSIGIFTLHCWLSSPAKEEGKPFEEDELKLYELIAKILTDLRPPAGST